MTSDTNRPSEGAGTFSCSICGKTTPHHHSAAEIAEHAETEAWAEESLRRFRALEAARETQTDRLAEVRAKPVAERTDADLLRLIAEDHQRLAPNAYHSADTLRQIADRIAATQSLSANLANAEARVKELEALVTEALTKVDNDRTMWVPEWQIWAGDARAALNPGKESA